MQEQNRKVTLHNRLGLHVRTATLLVKLASQFQCDVTLEREGFVPANAKSIMSVLTLAAPRGTTLIVKVKGADPAVLKECLDQIENLTTHGFNEEE